MSPFQLPDLEVQRIHPAAALCLIHLQGGDLLAQAVPGLVCGAIVLQKLCVSAAAVQITQVQQLLSIVLTVDIQQLTAQLPQLGHRHQPPVYPAHVASVPLDLPLEQHLSIMKSNAVLLQPREGRHLGKHRGHQGRLSPGADQLPGGTSAQYRAQGADGVDDNGFARAGLTGEDVVARFKADVR